MHQVPKYIPRIRLIRWDGYIWEYWSLTEAANNLYTIFRFDIRNHIGVNFRERRPGFGWCDRDFDYIIRNYTYVLRTEFGDVVTIDDLAKARTKNIYWTARWFSNRKNYKFRDGPVPYTGKRSRGVSLRYMRTTQEIREASALDFDEDAQNYGIKPRAKRNRANLPTAWDDYWHPVHKNWKKYRKHQWKNKK